jgi:hypothetical protein
MQELSKNKKFLAALVLGVCAGVAVFLFAFSIFSTVTKPFRVAKSGEAPGVKILPDSDSDGLTDKEEINTYHTDPMNPDTDEDGYMDGEEIALGTDPLNPDSHPASGPIRSLTANISDNFSHNMLGTILSDITDKDRLYVTDATGTSPMLHTNYTVADIEQLAGDVTNGFINNPAISSLRNIKDEEMKMSSKDDSLAAGRYLDDLNILYGDETKETAKLKDFFDRYNAYALDTINSGSGIFTVDSKLREMGEKEIIPALRKIETDLRNVTVPPSWKELHKDYVAMMGGQRVAISYLLSDSSDPLQVLYGMTILNKLKSDMDQWKQNMENMSHKFGV